MLLPIIITILVYSAFSAAVVLYKDISPRFSGVEDIDIVVGGPVLWLILGVIFSIRFLFKVFPPLEKKYEAAKEKRNENKRLHPPQYSPATINRTIDRVIKYYRRRSVKHNREREFFNLATNYVGDYSDICTAFDLITNKTPYRIEKKFNKMVRNQKKETISSLLRYAKPLLTTFKGDLRPSFIEEYGVKEEDLSTTPIEKITYYFD